MEDYYENVSPLYMQRLKNRVEETLWKLFPQSKYKNVNEYILRWHEEDGCYENFPVYYDIDSHIKLSDTRAGMSNNLLIKIAADIGVETPGILPCIPVMKNILNQNNSNAYTNFKRAIKNVYDSPDQSVTLAASTLEGVIKTILTRLTPDDQVDRLTLSKLTGKVVRRLIGKCNPSTPEEIKNLASGITKTNQAISELRNNKSVAHGKAQGEHVIDDALWAETVVNATATVGMLLWRLFERRQNRNSEIAPPSGKIDSNDIPF